MRVGLIARGEDRGLGLQTWEVSRHLDCDVLLVNVEDRFDCHFDRYPGAGHVGWAGNGFRNRQKVQDWLERQDVVYTAETFYDPQFTTWAHNARVPIVCHLNPEFWRQGPISNWWNPTSWRMEHVHRAAKVVPYPVALDRWPAAAAPHDGPCRWLHVAGRGAMWDRNGTEATIAALAHLREPCHVTICTQGEPPEIPATRPGVTVEVRGHEPDYWRLYEGHDALVMPRRYGGLCLPVNEAMGAGLAVAMTDVSPNTDTWPVVPIMAKPGRTERMYAGHIEVADVDPFDIAVVMDTLADPDARAEAQRQARAWAERHSWEVLGPAWMEEFAALRA